MTVRLPSVLITGVTKSGTTSLFTYLVQHPQICGASLKETEYFSRLVYPDAKLEPLPTYERYFRHCRDERYVLEASPNYWYGGARLLEATETVLNRPRYILSLRNPVDRFWSDFTYMRSKVLLDKDMTVQQFLDQCIERRARGADFTEAGRRFRTLSTGCYIDYIRDWLPVVEDRAKIVFFEHLAAHPDRVVRDILQWLDLAPSAADDFDYSQRNPTIRHRSAAFQRLAYAGGGRLDERLRRYPRAKEFLTGIYYRLNSAGSRSESLDGEVRIWLEDFYRTANQQLRDELSARGHQQLPSWLADA